MVLLKDFIEKEREKERKGKSLINLLSLVQNHKENKFYCCVTLQGKKLTKF